MTQLMKLTTAAADQIRALMAEAPKDEKCIGIRLGVVAAGCSGLSYNMEYVTAENPADVVVEDKGVKVYIDPRAQLYIAGMEMDYAQGQFESGFVFNNPNAVGQCGCGKSFRVEDEGA